MSKETAIYEQLARYLRLQYPKAVYKFNHEDARRRGYRLQYLIKLLQSDSGYPDLFIAEPHGLYHGFFLEIKTEANRPFKKDGTLKSGDHIRQQHEVLKQLRKRGYYAQFGVGFDDCQYQIDEYLSQDRLTVNLTTDSKHQVTVEEF